MTDERQTQKHSSVQLLYMQSRHKTSAEIFLGLRQESEYLLALEDCNISVDPMLNN